MSATALSLAHPASLDEAAALLRERAGAAPLAGGTDLVPLVRDGLVRPDELVDVRRALPRGVEGGRIGAGTTLAELERSDEIPSALREACRLAASPQLRTMGTIGGNLLQATRCWYWRLAFPCRLHGGDACHARDGEHREHAIFANGFCASAHPSDPAAALLALGAEVETTARRFPLAELYRLPDEGDRDLTTLEQGELILALHVEPPDASIYLKAMDRRRFAFPLVGVAAVRHGREARIALAGVAPIPYLLPSAQELDRATPLPGTAYKVEIARALVSRALAALG
ncbi:MAG TPA: FAD binding domain-containing protein [Gaiellaceae bacterium]